MWNKENKYENKTFYINLYYRIPWPNEIEVKSYIYRIVRPCNGIGFGGSICVVLSYTKNKIK